MKLQLKPVMETNFLSHELEDNLDNTNQSEKINFYDSDYNQNLNTWTEVQEPPSSHVDRHAASQVKVIKTIVTDEHDEHNDTSSMVMTSEGGIKEGAKIKGHYYQKSSGSTLSKKSNKKMRGTSSSNSSGRSKKEEIKAFQQQLKLKMSKKEKMVEFRNDNDDENQPDTNPIIDLPSYDLPDKLFVNKDKELENKYTVNLDDLRKEREIELKKKEEEQRQMEEKEKRARYEAILANRQKKNLMVKNSHLTQMEQ